MTKRKPFKPSDHGFDMRPDQFRALVAKAFDRFCLEDKAFDRCDRSHETLTVDELLLNPQVAIAFCADFRLRTQAHNLQDHEILRALLNHRKARGGRT